VISLRGGPSYISRELTSAYGKAQLACDAWRRCSVLGARLTSRSRESPAGGSRSRESTVGGSRSRESKVGACTRSRYAIARRIIASRVACTATICICRSVALPCLVVVAWFSSRMISPFTSGPRTLIPSVWHLSELQVPSRPFSSTRTWRSPLPNPPL